MSPAHPRRSARIWAVLAAAVAIAAALATAPAPAAAQRADLVRIPFPQEDGSLTPYTFELGYSFVTLVYDTLTARDRNGVPRPWLARSVRRSDDGLTLTIELRRGVRWHDGRPLTADDVVFTFDHVAARPHPRFTPQLRDIASVVATDSQTVVITLERPSLGFIDQPLADMPILPRHIWEGLPPNIVAPPGLPVGSGPYRLVEHLRGKLYRFEAYRRYFRGRPNVDEIDVPILPRADEAFDALDDRRVDVVSLSFPEEASRSVSGQNIRVTEGLSYAGTVLMLNTRRSPLDRPEVRRSISQALDLDRIADSLGDLPLTESVVPADRGYLHPASSWATRVELHRFRPQAARVAVAEQALPPLQVIAPRNDSLRVEAGREVVQALGRVGIRARLREVSAAALARAVGRGKARPTFEAAIFSNPALSSYDPSFLRALFGDPSRTPLNYPGYRSAEFERSADAVAQAATVEARQRAVDSELAVLARDLPAIPLFFSSGGFAIRPDAYDGWVFVKGTGIIDKRSFLGRGRRLATRAVGDPVGEPGDDGLSLVPVIVALCVLILVAVAWQVVRRPR